MDIAALSMSLGAIDTTNQVGVALLSKAMDNSQAIGAGIVEMIDSAAMERSVNPAVGSNFDMYV
ncbi:MAG: YjfB family protein [Eubacterium sp.]|nr:YjfB family protein [Eubacterium sp.]